jgi:FemAB-related protein (PEP-CTERM system-associated)
MDSNIDILVCGAEDRSDWDDFVQRFPGTTVCHLFHWRSIIRAAYGHRPVYLMARVDRQVRGLLPLFVVKSRLFGRVMSSLPFLDYGGICADNPIIARALLTNALQLLPQEGVEYVELRQCARFPQVDGAHLDKVGMRLDISGGTKQLWQSFPTKIRNHVRKAERSGLRVVIGEQEFLDEFYAVFAANMRDLGSPVHHKRFFAEIFSESGAGVKLFVVRDGQRAVGGLVCLLFRDTATVFWSSSLREYFSRCPNNLLYWTALQYAYDQGCKWFDFGRSSIGSGTYDFKRQWGAKPVQIYWHILNAAGVARAPMMAENSKYHLALAIWKRLPLAVTTLMGPRVRKYITN